MPTMQMKPLKLTTLCSLPEIDCKFKLGRQKASLSKVDRLHQSVFEVGRYKHPVFPEEARRKMLVLLQKEKLSWFKSRGKEKLQVFSNDQLAQLKHIFRTLDTERKKYLYPEQLYQPFISLGLVQNYDELISVIERYDDNKNGKIELEEFLNIAKDCLELQDLEKVKSYFNNLLNGRHEKSFKSCFGLYFQKKRREMIMQALRGIVNAPSDPSQSRSKEGISKIIREISKISNAEKRRQ